LRSGAVHSEASDALCDKQKNKSEEGQARPGISLFNVTIVLFYVTIVLFYVTIELFYVTQLVVRGFTGGGQLNI
jgi:hypothetical protein